MTAAILVLLSALCLSIHFVISSHILSRSKGLDTSLYLFASHTVAFLISLIPLFFMNDKSGPWISGSQFFFAFLISVCMTLFSKNLQYSSFVKLDLSLVSSFSALTPVFTVVLSYFVLKEIPKEKALWGIFLTTIAVYFLFLQKPDRKSFRTILNPLRHIWSDSGARLALLSSIPGAISITFARKGVLGFNPLFFSSASLFAFCLGNGVVAKLKTGSIKIKVNSYWPLIASGLFLALGQIFSTLATRMQFASYISAMSRVSIFFQTLLAYMFLNQRKDLAYRLALSIFILAGYFLIASA